MEYILLFNIIAASLLIGCGDGSDRTSLKVLNSGPTIDPHHSKDVIAIIGGDIRLSCHIEGLQNHTVSWIRHNDTLLLTFGKVTYTPDTRISPLHPVLTPVWQLRIAGVQKSDEGKYECQVSTNPPLGHTVHLSVVDPVTEIIGGPDVFVDQGSTINLTCVAKLTPGRPDYVQWFHGNKEISWEGPRSGVSSIMEAGQQQTVSQLLMQSATVADSGNYSCQPAHSRRATVTLHVLQGKFPAAIQAGHSIAPTFSFYVLISFLLFVLDNRINCT